MNVETRIYLILVATLLLLAPISVAAQPIDRDKIIAQLGKEHCVQLDERKLKFCRVDYVAGGWRVDAISIFPSVEGKYPGVVLLPGFEGTAKTLLGMAAIFAQQGFACLALTPPGFGDSGGKRDFMGPATIDAFAVGFRNFAREPYVDAKKMGIFGYSRGGMAASLLAVKLGKDVHAAVFGSGVYDFKRAYHQTRLDGIRENMKAETGMTEVAIVERSSVLHMENLKCPVLIIHGAVDANAPTNQAYVLRDRLIQLNKEFEFIILPDHIHGQIKSDFLSPVLAFLSRKLKGKP
ncbi:MAG TPA: alpha/beta fold hydrolase [Pyrinomonadaceae bacterium]|nr:alpha/beta fold hydrolase [Pyrinomonadaceae bacterium]